MSFVQIFIHLLDDYALSTVFSLILFKSVFVLLILSLLIHANLHSSHSLQTIRLHVICASRRHLNIRTLCGIRRHQKLFLWQLLFVSYLKIKQNIKRSKKILKVTVVNALTRRRSYHFLKIYTLRRILLAIVTQLWCN